MTVMIEKAWKQRAVLFISSILLILGLTGCVLNEEPQKQSTQPDQTDPPATTQPIDETQPPEPIKGTVTAKELKIRAGVGDFHDQAGLLNQGDIVEILEQTEVNGVRWGRIAEGWICLTQVQLEGEASGDQDSSEHLEMDGAITGTVIAEELNLRAGPGTKYKVVKRLEHGDSITVTEMSGTWGKTEDGWLNTVFAYFPDSMDSKTIHAIVTADILNVRTGPSTSYESLRKIEHGEEVEIIKQVTIRNILWGYIGDGWICMDYIEEK